MDNKQILIRFSTEDIKILNQLSKNENLKKSEYLRLIIKIIYIAKQTKSNDQLVYNINEYGYKLKKDYIKNFAKDLEILFKGMDKIIEKIILVDTISDKKIMYKKIKNKTNDTTR